jgi:hypothetical protein
MIKVLLWLVLAFCISCQETTYKKEVVVDNNSSAAFTNESGEVVTTIIAIQDSLAAQNVDHNLSCQEILDPIILAQNANNVSFNQVNTCRNARAEQQQMSFLEQADHDSCGTDHVLTKPEIREDLPVAEQMISNGRAQRALVGQSVSDNTTYNIPVVFHIIHRGEPIGIGPNISDAQILSALTALNNHFRKVPGTSGDGAGVDFNMQFVLAKRDPNNNPHSGINRINGNSVPNFSTLGIEGAGTGADEVAVKNLSRWNNLSYVNIWVVPEIDNNDGGAGIQGYAYFPTSSNSNASRDGIVMLHSATGTIGSVKGYTNEGKTLSHEMGHHFSLYHTFNATNSCSSVENCASEGDRVCDTPKTISSTSCSVRACGNQQVENYMDYTSETCKNMFTQGQRDRARDSLLSLRPGLVESLGGIPVNNLDVAIMSGSIPSFVCQAGVIPSVRISNFGSTTISSATVRYRIDNGAWVNSNYVGSLPSSAIATINFPALGLLSSGNHTIEFNVTAPNGGTDQVLTNNSLVLNFNSPSTFENFNFKVTLDLYGSENTIEVKNGSSMIYSAGPFQNSAQGTVVNNNFCLPVGCFDFIIKDLYGDGQSFTSGKYEIINGAGTISATNSLNWGSSKTHNICATGATSGGTSAGGTAGGGGSTTGGGGGGGDVTAPSVSITSPTQNMISNGGSTNLISISATASDNIGVSRVEFYYNSTLIASDSTSPYSTSWSVSSLTSANYNLSAKAFDAAGNSMTSNVVVFSLDKVAPTGNFISPLNASSLLPSTLLSASGTDNNGINRIEFYQGSVLLNSDTTPPFEFNWNTSSLPNGNYTLSLKIFDNAENMFSPSTISVSKSSSTNSSLPSTYPGIILGCYSLNQLESLQNALGCQISCSANLDVNGDGKILINDYLEMRGRICHE